jgi:hypothetical protein
MAGDAIDHATNALLEDLVSFFPSLKDRENIQRVIDAIRRMMDTARDLIETRLSNDELNRVVLTAFRAVEQGAEPERAVEQAFASAGISSGVAPELSAQIPGR